MRKFIQITEALNPTATRTRSDLSSLTDLGNTSSGELAPHRASEISLNTQAGEQTRTALGNMRVPQGMAGTHANILRDLEAFGGEDEISDAQALANAGADANGVGQPVHTPPATADNLPMVIRQELMAHGDSEMDNHFDPEWHQIKHLPGMIQSSIRQVGRAVFRQFTNVPIEDIQMMADLLNSPTDVKKMASWIVKNGVEQTSAKIDFAETLPSYAALAGAAECKLYNAAGYQFLIMRDRGGHYIYGWPEDDGALVDMSGNGGPALGRPQPRLR